jgi:hypothetical protein
MYGYGNDDMPPDPFLDDEMGISFTITGTGATPEAARIDAERTANRVSGGAFLLNMALTGVSCNATPLECKMTALRFICQAYQAMGFTRDEMHIVTDIVRAMNEKFGHGHGRRRGRRSRFPRSAS